MIADDTVPIWNISTFERCLAWNVTHLFSGAYEGWLRAMWWLQQANIGLSFATHTSVDWCPDVMKTWSFNHGKEFMSCPVPVNFASTEVFNGFLADISDRTLPPCPSWSRGGKHSGLATDEGFCFLDAIEHVARTRPDLALFECSDGIEAHPHWRVLTAALQLAGYQKLWSQDVAIHQLTGNHRTRWLAVWARHDVQGQKIHERFVCSIPRRLSWRDEKHQHLLPSALAEDLVLKPPQMLIYGDRNLLPPAKRSRVGEDASTEQVLTQRLVQQSEYLPTLCASYSCQHLLQQEHLISKGIYASLISKNEQFCFIDPFTFVVLFGTSDSIGLPTDLRKAFHQLGNAITQTHALIPILIAMEGVTGENFQKLSLVQQCWDDRLTIDKALIRTWDDMYVLLTTCRFYCEGNSKCCNLATMACWPHNDSLL